MPFVQTAQRDVSYSCTTPSSDAQCSTRAKSSINRCQIFCGGYTRSRATPSPNLLRFSGHLLSLHTISRSSWVQQDPKRQTITYVWLHAQISKRPTDRGRPTFTARIFAAAGQKLSPMPVLVCLCVCVCVLVLARIYLYVCACVQIPARSLVLSITCP
jgi:hypothetical protein